MTPSFPIFSDLRRRWAILIWWINWRKKEVFTALMDSIPASVTFSPTFSHRTYSIGMSIRVNRSCGEERCAAKFYRLTSMESKTQASINASENCSINTPFRLPISVSFPICTCIKAAINQHDWEIYFYIVCQILKPIVSNSSKPSKLSKREWHISTWWVSLLHNKPFCKNIKHKTRVQKNWDNSSKCKW